MAEFEKDPMTPRLVNSVYSISANAYERFMLIDNGGRRTGGDRRNYSYSVHLPERRDPKDRRSGRDRRKFPRYKCA
jgi:hypothetical protein